MIISKNTKFKLGEQKVIATRIMHIEPDERGVFILNMWEPCDEADINILPVNYVGNLTEQDLYILKKDNVILGESKDICLE